MQDLKKKSLLLFNKVFPFLTIALIVGVFFWPVFLKGLVPIPADFVVGTYYPWLDYKWGFPAGVPVKNPITTDVVSFTYPMQTLAVDMLKKRELPLWNPYILAGTPLLANFQSAPFSPTNFVYFFLDKLSAWSLQIVLQHFLAAVFTYLLLRNWKVGKTAAVFGGIIYAFTGFNLIWSQWNGHTLAAAFIPLTLLFVDKWLTVGRVRWGMGISFSLFLMFLSGYPQIIIYLGLAVSLLWLFRIFQSKNKLMSTVGLGIFLLLGFGLAAFQVLPGAELLSLSQREVEPHPYEWAFLPFEKIITFLAPDYFGNHATKNYWGPQDYTSNTGFVGVAAFTLAIAGLGLIRNRKEVFYGFAVLIVSLLFAFPTPVSIFLWKSGILGMNAASAHRSLVLFDLSIALLAGFGIDRFLKGEKINLRRIFVIPSLILLGFGSWAGVYFLLSSNNPEVYSALVKNFPAYTIALRNLVLPSVILISVGTLLYISKKLRGRLKNLPILIVIALGIFEIFRFGWKFTPFSPRELVYPMTPVLTYLTSQAGPVRITGSKVVPINMRMPYGLESLEGYDAVYPLRISQLLTALNSGRSGTDPVGRYGTVDNLDSRLLDLVGVQNFLVIKRNSKKEPSPTGKIPADFLTNRFSLAHEDKSVAVLENKNALPRAFMVYDWEILKDNKQVLDKLLSNSFPLGEKIVLEESVPMNRLIGTKGAPRSVEYTKYAEMESTMQVETNKDGILFVSDTFYPGWRAFLDGVETKIYRADFAFRAIPVPAGNHEVKFIYSPDSFYDGLKVSVFSLGLLAAIGVGAYLLGKNRRGDYTSN